MNPVYALQKINTWWKTGEVDATLLHKRIRSEFMDVLKSIGDKRITNIVGPYGVGKTSLLYCTINHLLKSNIPPERIVYFSGDEMILFGEHRSIGSLLEIYATEILHENLFAFREPVYIFIDDIEFIEDWQIYLLNYLDKTVNIKFFIAQTHTPFSELDEKNEYKIIVMPLNLPQYSEFYFAYKLHDLDLVRYKSLMPEPSVFADPVAFFEELYANIYALRDFKPYKSQIVSDYLLSGGYPAYFSSNDITRWQAQLLNITDCSLYRDIGAFNNIKSPQKLKKLLYIIAEQGRTEQSFGKIGRSLYVDTSTIIGYISNLSEGGFAGVQDNFSPESGVEGRIVRKNKRFYIYDTGIANAIRCNTSIAENFNDHVTNAFLYMAKRYAMGVDGNVYFWKNGIREVDIVLYEKGKILPVSVCCQKENLERTIKSTRAFMRNYGVKTAIIITRDLIKSDRGIIFLPYWMF
ncbi:AAA family ATPase [[Clostridium] cellulosi]